MIARIVRFSLARRFTVFYTTILLACLGLVAARTLPSDLLPELSSPIVTVLVENPSLAPQEVEALITRPLEGAMRGVPRVVSTRSTSVQGLSTVVAEFDWDTDYTQALQQIGSQLGSITSTFPPGTRAPTVASATSRLNQVLEYYLRRAQRPINGHTPAPIHPPEATRQAGGTDSTPAPELTPRIKRALRDLADYDVRYAVLGTPGVLKVTEMGG